MGEGRGGCFPKAFLPLPPRQGVGGEQSGEYKFGLSEWTIFQKGGDPPPIFGVDIIRREFGGGGVFGVFWGFGVKSSFIEQSVNLISFMFGCNYLRYEHCRQDPLLHHYTHIC